jgi:hypothetical protein
LLNQLTQISRHVCVPDFGFRLPAFTPAKAAPTKYNKATASLLGGTPTELAAMRSSTPAPAVALPAGAKVNEAPTTKPDPTSLKQLSRAEIAAAATRACMAEIMGPRRRQITSSTAKGKGLATSSKSGQGQPGGGDKQVSESKNDDEMDLTY